MIIIAEENGALMSRVKKQEFSTIPKSSLILRTVLSSVENCVTLLHINNNVFLMLISCTRLSVLSHHLCIKLGIGTLLVGSGPPSTQ